METEFKRSFFSCESSSDAIKLLFRQSKKENPHFSLEFLSRKLGIKSKSYISDIIQGRKKISLNQRYKIAKSFKLDREMTRFLETLIELEHEPHEVWRESLVNELSQIRKSATRKIIPIESSHDFLFLLKLYASFGLFSSRPRLHDILSVFPGVSLQRVENKITELVSLGAIKKEEEHYQIIDSQLFFKDQGSEPLELFKEALRENIEHVEEYYHQEQLSLFRHTYLSIQKEKLPHFLEEFRHFAKEWEQKCENTQSDMVICQSLQLYPVVSL